MILESRRGWHLSGCVCMVRGHAGHWLPGPVRSASARKSVPQTPALQSEKGLGDWRHSAPPMAFAFSHFTLSLSPSLSLTLMTVPLKLFSLFFFTYFHYCGPTTLEQNKHLRGILWILWVSLLFHHIFILSLCYQILLDHLLCKNVPLTNKAELMCIIFIISYYL